MNPPKTRWTRTKREIGILSASLKPIRTAEEVGRILGMSATTVFKLENSALRKIFMALNPPGLESTQFKKKTKKGAAREATIQQLQTELIDSAQDLMKTAREANEAAPCPA